MSSLRPKIKAGRHDIVEETNVAEMEIRFKDIVGAPAAQAGSGIDSQVRYGKPGLGLQKIREDSWQKLQGV